MKKLLLCAILLTFSGGLAKAKTVFKNETKDPLIGIKMHSYGTVLETSLDSLTVIVSWVDIMYGSKKAYCGKIDLSKENTVILSKDGNNWKCTVE